MYRDIAMVSVPEGLLTNLVFVVTGKLELALEHPDGVISWAPSSGWVFHHDIDSAMRNGLRRSTDIHYKPRADTGVRIQGSVKMAGIDFPGDESFPLIIKASGAISMGVKDDRCVNLPDLVF